MLTLVNWIEMPTVTIIAKRFGNWDWNQTTLSFDGFDFFCQCTLSQHHFDYWIFDLMVVDDQVVPSSPTFAINIIKEFGISNDFQTNWQVTRSHLFLDGSTFNIFQMHKKLSGLVNLADPFLDISNNFLINYLFIFSFLFNLLGLIMKLNASFCIYTVVSVTNIDFTKNLKTNF